MNVYSLPEAQKSLPVLLEQSMQDGEILIRDASGWAFSIKPKRPTLSPLDVPGLSLNLDAAEIVSAVRKSRNRGVGDPIADFCGSGSGGSVERLLEDRKTDQL